MAESTAIEWTDASWNPWRGCDKVSPGCAECYMFRDQRRYGRDPEVVVRAAPSTFYAPLRSKKWAKARLVFTCSWSDWFHPVADEWRPEAWEIIRQTPHHTYQILTKRPELIPERLPDDWGEGYPNVWLGVSIENRRFIERADLLRQVPAALRFISAEPLLGPLVPFYGWRSPRDRAHGRPPERFWSNGYVGKGLDLTDIDWLIAGGESGGREGRRLVDSSNRPREEQAEWIRGLRDACEATGTAFFFKQWGGPRPESGGRVLDGRVYNEMPV